ncbi:hypothetical protein ACP70R_039147 [Stipagrostis hirtigluma subsp. patula]
MKGEISEIWNEKELDFATTKKKKTIYETIGLHGPNCCCAQKNKFHKF